MHQRQGQRERERGVRNALPAYAHRRGWTIIEMMIVLVVLGVLIAMAAMQIRRVRVNSRVSAATSEVEMIAAAIERLAWDTGMWPGALLRNVPQNPETWDLTADAAGLLDTDGSFPNWQGPYLRELPLDPWGQPYFFDPDYRVSGVNRVAVGSFGPNEVGRNLYDEDDIYIILK